MRIRKLFLAAALASLTYCGSDKREQEKLCPAVGFISRVENSRDHYLVSYCCSEIGEFTMDELQAGAMNQFADFTQRTKINFEDDVYVGSIQEADYQCGTAVYSLGPLEQRVLGINR